MSVATPMIITLVIYILGMVLLGFLAYMSTKNFDDYILGGRSLSGLVTALSAGASDMSGWLLMGLPGSIFTYGISSSWIVIGLTIGAWVNWKIVAGRLRIQTEHYNNSLTLPDFFSNRFEDYNKIIRMISVSIILIFFTIYCSSGILAGTRLFEKIFLLSYTDALWISTAVTVLYTLLGGFLAVSWTDTVQASLMVFALILTPCVVIIAVGGFSHAITMIKIADPDNINMFKNFNFIAFISLLGWGLGYFGQPHILVRFMASNSRESISIARRIGMAWMILCLGGAVAVGFFGIAYFQNHPEQSTLISVNNENIFLELAVLLFNPWISGILLSAILAAVMSTLSCQLLLCSSTLTEDIYKGLLRKNASQKELVWIGRLMILIVSIFAIMIASNPDNRILKLVGYAWAGFGASFGPVILFSLCWSRITRRGAIAGMLTGASTVLIWHYYNWFNLYEIVPAFIFSCIMIVFVSLIDNPPSQDAQQRFNMANKKYLSK